MADGNPSTIAGKKRKLAADTMIYAIMRKYSSACQQEPGIAVVNSLTSMGEPFTSRQAAEAELQNSRYGKSRATEAVK